MCLSLFKRICLFSALPTLVCPILFALMIYLYYIQTVSLSVQSIESIHPTEFLGLVFYALPIPIILFAIVTPLYCFYVNCMSPIFRFTSKRLRKIEELQLEESSSHRPGLLMRLRMCCVFPLFSSVKSLYTTTEKLRNRMSILVTLLPSYVFEDSEEKIGDDENLSDTSSSRNLSSKNSSERTSSTHEGSSNASSGDSTFFLKQEIKFGQIQLIQRMGTCVMKLVIWNFHELLNSQETIKNFTKLAVSVERAVTKFRGTVERWGDGELFISWNTHRTISCTNSRKAVCDLAIQLGRYLGSNMCVSISNLFSIGLFCAFGESWIGNLGTTKNRNFHIDGPTVSRISVMQEHVRMHPKEYNQNGYFMDRNVAEHQMLVASRPLHFFPNSQERCDEFFMMTTVFHELPDMSNSKEWMYQKRDEEIHSIEKVEVFEMLDFVENGQVDKAISMCKEILHALKSSDALLNSFLKKMIINEENKMINFDATQGTEFVNEIVL